MSDYQPKKSLSTNRRNPNEWISIQEASHRAPYSQEYLSLLARRGKIFAKKIGRNWYTTNEALDRYVAEQALLSPISKQFGPTVKLASSTNLVEEFKRLNPQAFGQDTKPELGIRNQELGNIKQGIESTPPVIPDIAPTPAVTPVPLTPTNFSSDEKSGQRQVGEDILGKLDRLSDSLETFASSVTASIPAITQASQTTPSLDPEVEEFVQERINSSIHRLRHFDRFAKSTARSPVRLMTIMITAVVLIFVLIGGFSFGKVDAVAQKIKKAFTDATTIDGHFAGTHANEVLILDKAGNISIYGHIETQGQLRSYAPDGVAPIVVDSMTKVENLNADYIDNLSAQDFTLAFVTKNGNLTYEDVHLMGDVEVGKLLKVGGSALIGKTLTVSGATKLMDSLTVYGKLGVLSDAVFGKDVTLTNGNLIIGKGTIKISNMTLIKNLNAEYLDGVKKGDINLDFVTDNGNTTSNPITVGELTSTGTITAYGPGFFNSSIWSPFGSFGDLGVGKSAIFGDSKNRSNSKFEVYSSKFTVDGSGNLTASGDTYIGGMTTTGSLLVQGSVLSNLIPSGSFDLGSLSNRWDDLYVVNGDFSGDLIVSGSLNFAGVTSSSFVINTDNIASDSENSYLAFSRGLISPDARITWDAASKQFDFNEPVKISSGSFVVAPNGDESFRVTSSGASLSVPFELIGTASISDTLTLGGIITSSNTGSNSFAGSLDITKGLRSNVITATSGLLTNSISQYNAGPLTINAFTLGGLVTGNNQSITGLNQLTSSIASISTNFEVGGYASIGGNVNTMAVFVSSGTGSNSFAGSLNLDKGIHATGNSTTLAQFLSSGTGSNSFSGSLDITKGLRAAQITGTNLIINTGNIIGNGTGSSSFAGSLDITKGLRSANFTQVGTGTNYFNGNVGIGTTAPGAKLDVVSDVIFREGLQVAGTATASYSRFGTGTTNHSNYISASNDVLVSGDLEILGTASFEGNVVIGATSTTTLAVGSTVKSDLIPFTNAYNLGSTTNHWGTIYVDTANITNLEASTASISGTIAADFLVNSDNVSPDTEDMSITFKRGSPTVNAALEWDSTNKRFNFNFPVFIQTVDNPEPTYNFTNVTLKGAVDQGEHHYFDIQDNSGNGILTVGPTGWLTVSGSFQAGGGSLATKSYSRFGTGATNHGLSVSSDLLVSGKFEIDGQSFFDDVSTFTAGASVSTNFEVGGYASIGGNVNTMAVFVSSGTGSNSFAGSLNLTKGLHATGNVTTLAQFLSSGTGSNSFAGSFDITKGLRSNVITATSGLLTNSITQYNAGPLTINAFTLGGLVTGNNQSITGLNQLTSSIASISTNFEVGGYASISGLITAGSGITSNGTLAMGTNNITSTGSIGATGARLIKGWFTDLEVTNAIVGSITGNAATVTTNANLTGPITSVGNATAVASQTGTGSTFVMQASPTLTTPTLGAATYTTLSGGNITDSGLTAGRITFAGTAGILSDDAELTYNSTTNALTTTTFSGALSGNATTATALQTGRTITITGDLTYTSPAFDGSGNVTGAGTLATVNVNVGSFGSSTAIPTFTVNGKGLITAAGTAVVIAPAGTLTGATLAANVLASSLTSVGTLSSGAVPASLVTAGTFGTGAYVMDTSLTVPLINGSSADNGDITINGTSSATKTSSYVILQATGGNVGIGTTGPVELLDLKKAHAAAYGSFTPLINLNGYFPGFDENAQRATIDAGVPNAGNTTYGHIGFSTRGADGLVRRVVIDNSGNVGIGTTGPSRLLHISAASGNLETMWSAAGNGANLKNWQWQIPSTGVLSIMSVNDALSSSVTNMTFDRSGNVGIGTTNPTSGKLQIERDTDGTILYAKNTYASFSGIAAQIDTTRAANAGFELFRASANGATQFYINGVGNVVTAGTLTVSGTGNSSIAGNVGIGTTAPGDYDDEGDDFVLYSASAAGNGMSIISPTTGRGHLLFGDGTGASTYRGAITYDHGTGMGGIADSMYFRTAGTVKATIDANGNVGIGTTGPGARLDIKSSGDGTYVLKIIASGTTNNLFAFAEEGVGSKARFEMYNGSGTQTVQIHSAGNSYFNGGNVGIGTTEPLYPLHVVGNEHVTGWRSTLAGNALTWNVNSASQYIATNFGSAVNLETGDGRMAFYTAPSGTAGNAATFTERLTILTGGNVGIGDSTPDYLLDVAGTFNVDGAAYFPGMATDSGCIGCVNVRTTAAGGTMQLFYASSARRLKKNIDVFAPDWRAFLALPTVKFHGLSQADDDPYKEIGYIADDAADLGLEDLVVRWPNQDPNDDVPDGTLEIATIKYEKIPLYLAAGLRAAHERIAELDLKVNTISDNVDTLQGQFGAFSGVLNGLASVQEQCVTGDTRLRRRRKRKDGTYVFDEVCIADLYLGQRDDQRSADDNFGTGADEVLSLNQALGRLEYHRVNALLFMGVQEVFELTTASGRKIRTTSQHPFLTQMGA